MGFIDTLHILVARFKNTRNNNRGPRDGIADGINNARYFIRTVGKIDERKIRVPTVVYEDSIVVRRKEDASLNEGGTRKIM